MIRNLQMKKGAVLTGYDVEGILHYDCYVETFQALVKPMFDAQMCLVDALEAAMLEWRNEPFLLSVDICADWQKQGDRDISFLFLVEKGLEEMETERIMYLRMACR